MAKIKDNFTFAINNVLRRKTRSFLTVLAIVIGIGAVVALIGIGNGLENTINDQFEQMGTNKLFISPGGGLFSMGSGTGLTDEDLKIVEDITGVENVDGWTFKLGRIEYNDKIVYSWVLGTDPQNKDYEELMENWGIELVDGRYPKSNSKFKAIVGCMLAFDAEGNNFKKEMGVGKKFEIEGQEFQVAAVVSCVGNPQDDQNIYINLETLKELFNEKSTEYSMFTVTTDEGRDLKPIIEDIEKDLRKHRDLEEGEEDFQIQSAEQLIETFTDVFGVIVVVIGGIASISLLVGGIGIANTMFTSVLERTREIGVMKAIGAQNRDVLLIIMFESGFLGLFGGAIGVAIGYLLAKLLGFIVTEYFRTLLTVRFSPSFIIGILLFSFVLGIISGFIPAYRASKMNPVDALRYE